MRRVLQCGGDKGLPIGSHPCCSGRQRYSRAGSSCELSDCYRGRTNTLMLMGETGVQLVVEYLQNMHKALDLIAMPHIKWHTDKEQLLK